MKLHGLNKAKNEIASKRKQAGMAGLAGLAALAELADWLLLPRLSRRRGLDASAE